DLFRKVSSGVEKTNRMVSDMVWYIYAGGVCEQ
ncbi:MAG: hypothetical protein K0Q73_9168, partial [Paenibacillus sp.]|nr:hypothetical protein [Paenibacillus sp.]